METVQANGVFPNFEPVPFDAAGRPQAPLRLVTDRGAQSDPRPEGLKAVTRAHFNSRAVNWDERIHQRPYRQRFEAVRSLVPDGACLVDLGCGTGDYSALSSNYVGIDNSARMIERAAMLFPHKAFCLEDVEKTSLPDGCADFVIAIGLLEYLEDPRLLVDEMRRIVKLGGRVICHFKSKEKASLPVRALHRLYKRLGGERMTSSSLRNHQLRRRKFTKQEALDLFSGFEHVQTTEIFFQKIFISEFRRRY